MNKKIGEKAPERLRLASAQKYVVSEVINLRKDVGVHRWRKKQKKTIKQ